MSRLYLADDAKQARVVFTFTFPVPVVQQSVPVVAALDVASKGKVKEPSNDVVPLRTHNALLIVAPDDWFWINTVDAFAVPAGATIPVSRNVEASVIAAPAVVKVDPPAAITVAIE